MSAAAADEPLKLDEVLEAEHAHLHGSAPDRPLRNRCAYSALCLSGGGIRSASFALGVIQALGRKGLLRFGLRASERVGVLHGQNVDAAFVTADDRALR